MPYVESLMAECPDHGDLVIGHVYRLVAPDDFPEAPEIVGWVCPVCDHTTEPDRLGDVIRVSP